MFKQIDIELNGKQITMAPQTYPYKAIIETMIGFTEDAKKTYLTGSLYKADSTLNPNVIDASRAEFIKNSDTTPDKSGKVLDLMGKLHLDLAFQERAIVGGSTLKITLTPHAPSFYLRGSGDSVIPNVYFLDASLFVHRSKVSPSIVEAHELANKKATIKYPLCRNEVKSFSINSGTLSANIDNIVQGQIPRRAFVGLVKNEAFNGSLDENPFNFKHYDLNFMAAYVDGIQYPSVAYTPDFTNDLYIREYLGLFEAVNQLTTDAVIAIDRKAWKNGNTLFGFNFAPDLANGCVQEGHTSPIKKGSLGLQLKFKKSLPDTINVLVYLEYDNVIEIDENKQVTTDFI